MTERSVVMGIDGGGTVTRAFCADLQGNIRGTASTGGANPGKNTDAAINIQQAVLLALEKANRHVGDVRALVAGISGYDLPRDDTWAVSLTEIPGLSCPRRHLNDAVVAHAGAFGQEPGIIAIGGTGSIVFGITETGREVRNYDFNNSPQASARGIAYQAVFRILIDDIAEEDAALVQSVLEYWEVPNKDGLRDLAAQNCFLDSREVMRRYGNLAPRITEAAWNGSPLARRVCDAAAEALGVAIRLVGTCFAPVSPLPIPVALVGSVVRSDYMSGAIRRQMETVTAPRGYKIVEPFLAPGVGAAALALSDAGVTVTPAVRAALQQDSTRAI